MEAIAFFSIEGNCDEQNINSNIKARSRKRIPIVSLEVTVEANDPDGFQEIANDVSDNGRVIFIKYSDGYREIDGEFAPDNTTWKRANIMYRAQEKIADLREYITTGLDNPQEHLNELPEVGRLNLNDLQKLRKDSIEALNYFKNHQSSDSKDEQKIEKESAVRLQKIMDDLATGLNETVDVFEALPEIIYYDEFDLINDEVPVDGLSSGENETIRKLLSYLEIDYKPETEQNDNELNTQLRRAERLVSKLVSGAWKQKSVEISISLLPDNVFRILVRDTALLQSSGSNCNVDTKADVERSHVRPSQRSKGFQWFLSFCLNLVVDEETAHHEKLILLDDPAVYLHPEGKKDALAAMEELPDKFQFMYATHSPFMIDKAYPERIRIIEDRGDDLGTKVTTNFETAEGIALEPVRNALGIGLGDLPYISKKKILLEGISDYYIITGVANYLKDYLGKERLGMEDVTFTPVGGADKIIMPGKWIASEDLLYILLLDNDMKGRNIKERIEAHHRDIDINQVILLEEYNDRYSGDFSIEDMFSATFFVECVNEVYRSIDEFECIPVAAEGEITTIGETPYDGDGIVSIVEEKLNSMEIELDETNSEHELRKREVAQKIKERLDTDEGVSESDISSFKPLLGHINGILTK